MRTRGPGTSRPPFHRRTPCVTDRVTPRLLTRFATGAREGLMLKLPLLLAMPGSVLFALLAVTAGLVLADPSSVLFDTTIGRGDLIPLTTAPRPARPMSKIRPSRQPPRLLLDKLCSWDVSATPHITFSLPEQNGRKPPWVRQAEQHIPNAAGALEEGGIVEARRQQRMEHEAAPFLPMAQDPRRQLLGG